MLQIIKKQANLVRGMLHEPVCEARWNEEDAGKNLVIHIFLEKIFRRGGTIVS